MAQKITASVIRCSFGAALLCAVFFARNAFAATLYLSPASGGYLTGHTFTVGVYVASPDEAINAVQGALAFPANELSVISISKADSVINLWVQDPAFSNQDGTVNFGGVVVNPGFQGPGGNIVTITFQVKNSGTAAVSFSSGSVLANDGKGTNILTGMQGADFTLTAAPALPAPAAAGSGNASVSAQGGLTVTSNPPITSSDWYNFDAITFNWTLPTDADGVSYALSNDPSYILPETSEGLATSTTIDTTKIADGTWYFFASFESGGAWSPVAVRSFQLDRTPPEPFVVVQKNVGTAAADQNPSFQWAAQDTGSGIAYYQAKIGDGDWFDPSSIEEGSVYVLPEQSPTASRTLTIRAYDQAGNYTDATINFSVGGGSCSFRSVTCWFGPFFTKWGWLLMLVVILLMLLAYWLLYRTFAHQRVLRRELESFKNELQHDLKQLEKRDIAAGKGGEMDLRPSRLAEKKESLEKAATHLAADVKEEIKKIEGMMDKK